jgi:hypothetical protein
LALLAATPWLDAQTSISSATFIVDSSASSSTSEGKTFENTVTSINTFVAGGIGYAVGATADSAYVRRNGTPNQSSVWYRQGSDFLGSHSADYGQLLLGNNVNRGSDNTFSNDGGAAGGNIERLDFVWSGGVTATNDYAVAVFDRGAAGAHDAIKVALITGWDAVNEVPTAYTMLASQAGNWGPDNLIQGTDVPGSFGYNLFRYNTGDNLSSSYASDETGSQGLGGVVFRRSDFGLSEDTVIYGYSLFGYDVTDGGDTANLLDWTNTSFYSASTSGATGSGGIDLAAVNGIAFSAVPEPSAYGLAAFAALAVWPVLRRRRRD